MAFKLCLWAQSTCLIYHKNKDILLTIIYKMQKNQHCWKAVFWHFLPPASLMCILWAGPKLNLKNILWFFPFQLHLSILKLLSSLWGINDLWHAHPLQSLYYDKAIMLPGGNLVYFVLSQEISGDAVFWSLRMPAVESWISTQIQLRLKPHDNNLEGNLAASVTGKISGKPDLSTQ